MIRRRVILAALCAAVAAACARDVTLSPPRTRARVDALRAQFASGSKPAIGRGIATGLEGADANHVRPVIPDVAKVSVRRSATAWLPTTANGTTNLEDDATHVAVSFALVGADEAPVEMADGVALYRGAYHGGDVVQRPHAEGTEDYVVFDARPSDESLAYDVDVTRVAGLRLVSNVLELLDESGAPRLRIATPHVTDAKGATHEAELAVEGCAVDVNPAGPWGRAVTRAGAASCRVRVTWSGVAYPALVDPEWSATGSMTTTRENHTATLLTSGPNAGRVLIAGGCSDCSSGATLSSAELFDGTSSFAATGSMTSARRYHAATLLTSGPNAGKVLVAGGFYLSSAELFDGTSTFTATGFMTTGRQGHTMTELPSGTVLVAGGFNGSYLSSAELFDGTSAFTATGSMTDARSEHTATLLAAGPNAGKVLVAGGSEGTSEISGAELFDGTSSFASTGSLTTARYNHTATLLESGPGAGMVLIAGGATILGDAELSSAELFDGTSSFTATGFMASERENHTATFLTSGPNAGRVLVVGGDYAGDAGTTPVPNAELFDGTSSFVDAGAMAVARTNHTATLLSSGEVLVAGGENGLNAPLSSAEIFLAVTEPVDAGEDSGAPIGVSDDAGVSPPSDDAGVSPPSDDAGVGPPSDDAGVGPPSDDAGVSSPSDDAGASVRSPQAKPASVGSGGGCSTAPAGSCREGGMIFFLLACAASFRARRRARRPPLTP